MDASSSLPLPATTRTVCTASCKSSQHEQHRPKRIALPLQFHAPGYFSISFLHPAGRSPPPERSFHISAAPIQLDAMFRIAITLRIRMPQHAASQNATNCCTTALHSHSIERLDSLTIRHRDAPNMHNVPIWIPVRVFGFSSKVFPLVDRHFYPLPDA